MGCNETGRCDVVIYTLGSIVMFALTIVFEAKSCRLGEFLILSLNTVILCLGSIASMHSVRPRLLLIILASLWHFECALILAIFATVSSKSMSCSRESVPQHVVTVVLVLRLVWLTYCGSRMSFIGAYINLPEFADEAMTLADSHDGLTPAQVHQCLVHARGVSSGINETCPICLDRVSDEVTIPREPASVAGAGAVSEAISEMADSFSVTCGTLPEPCPLTRLDSNVQPASNAAQTLEPPRTLPNTEDTLAHDVSCEVSPSVSQSQSSVTVPSVLWPTPVLPCGHQFHRSCLTKWLRVKNSCPICRRVVLQNQ